MEGNNTMTAQAILDILRNEWVEEAGIRVLHADEHPQAGESMPPSAIWVEGERMEEVLDGTCAIGINHLTLPSIQAAIDNVFAYDIGAGSPGRFALILGERGDRYDGLEDEAVVVRNAVVVATWTIPGNYVIEKGRSVFRPE